MKQAKKHIDKILFSYNLKLFVAAFLLQLSIACWLLLPILNDNFSVLIFLLVIVFAFFFSTLPFLFNDFKKLRKQKLISQLNESITPLNYSCRLLLKDKDKLNTIEQLLVDKSINYILQNASSIKLKNNLNAIFIFFAFNLIIVLSLSSFQGEKTKPVKTINFGQQIISPTENALEVKQDTLKLIKHKVTVKSPSYTKQKSYTQKDLNITAPEGSNITWDYHFNKTTTPLQFNLANKSKPFNTTDHINFSKSTQPKSNSIYIVQLNDSIKNPYINNIGEIKLIKDEAPIIKVSGISAYEELNIDEVNSINFDYELNDDYGIDMAELHLILSSGSGEGVKFKEDYIRLSGIANNASYRKNIDLKEYKALPGDEFYLRIRATDNKPVKPNISYSSTFIIAVKDTSKTIATFEMTLGTDLEPEYFRSQRQLIIDTEKLLEEEHNLTSIGFKEQSNNIGIDQKLLRLRYGKFLGEEFEGEIGVRKDEERQEIKSVSLEEKHKHQHDENCEHDHQQGEEAEKEHRHGEDCEHFEHNEIAHQHHHNETKEHDDENTESHQQHNHNHDHSSSNTDDPEQEENLLAPFMHFHDSGEINTFFESEVKSKLKAALAQMWKSELQLRIGEPKASLPYQHKALQLIKEVQQASRVYVERVGMKMPEIPIAKKRLTGDLAEVENLDRVKSFKNSDDYKVLKSTISEFNKVDWDVDLSTKDKILNKLMQQLYLASKSNSLSFASTINLVQQIANSKEINETGYLKLKSNLNSLLASIDSEKSGKKVSQNTRLTNLFQQYLHN